MAASSKAYRATDQFCSSLRSRRQQRDLVLSLLGLLAIVTHERVDVSGRATDADHLGMADLENGAVANVQSKRHEGAPAQRLQEVLRGHGYLPFRLPWMREKAAGVKVSEIPSRRSSAAAVTATSSPHDRELLPCRFLTVRALEKAATAEDDTGSGGRTSLEKITACGHDHFLPVLLLFSEQNCALAHYGQRSHATWRRQGVRRHPSVNRRRERASALR